MPRRRRPGVRTLVAFAVAAGAMLVGPAGAVPTVGAAGPVKILPLGNSLTEGYEVDGGPVPFSQRAGYRERLEDRFQDVGFDFDFVGTKTSGSARLDDTDHEGVSGDRIEAIRNRMNGLPVGLDPDVVLLIAGTNDLTDDTATFPLPANSDAAEAAMADLLDDLTSKWPDAKVVVSTLIQFRENPAGQRTTLIRDYNAALPGIVAAAGSNVSLVDSYPVITTEDIPGGDAIHPDRFGYGKIADVWFDGLSGLYPELLPDLTDPLVRDDFNRPDADLGTAPTGQIWVESAKSAFNPLEWGIKSSQVSVIGGNDEGIVTVDAGVSDVDVSADVVVSPTSGNPSLTLRAEDAGNQLVAGIVWRPGNNRLTLAKIVNGAATNLVNAGFFFPDTNGDGVSEGPSGTYNLRATVEGDTVEVWVDDVRWISYQLTAAEQTAFGSNTLFGFRAAKPGEDGNSRWDNFVLRGVPSAPSGVVGTAGDGRVSVSWVAPVSDGGSAITGYTVTAAPGGATCSTMGATSCTVVGLTNGTPYTFTVTATNAVGTGPASAPSTSVTPMAAVADLVTVEPARLLDTRPTGSTVDGQFLGAGKLVGGQFTKVKIAGRGGVAADAVGVELNITAIQNEGRGFATLYPCTATPPTASSLNYTPGVNIANATTVALNANGEVCVFSNVTAHYALDVLAYVPAGSDLVTVEPSRLLDTRPSGSTVDGQFLGAGKLVGGQFTKVKIAGRGGVAADAVGVELNITAIQNEGRGFATLYPCTATPPTASSLNYTPGVNIANATTVALNANGEVCVFSNVTAHYALDVLAYVPAGSDLVTVEPSRLLDTRPSGSTVDGQFLGAGKLVGGQFTKVKIAGRGGVAADAVGVELNITAIQNEGRGFATLYPCTATPPTASSLNYTPGVNIANATTVALNANGEVCVFSNVTAHYALDVLAYVAA